MHSIRIRFLISMCILVSITSFICLFFGGWLFFEQLRNSSINRLGTGREILNAVINYEFIKLKSDSKILSNLSDFIKKVEARQSQAVLKVAKKFQEQMLIDDFSSYDNDGNPIALADETNKENILNFFSLPKNKDIELSFKEALKGNSSIRFHVESEKVNFTSISPVISDKKSICGILTTSLKLDNKFTDRIKELSKSDVSIFANDRLIASSIVNTEEKKRLLDEFLKIPKNKRENKNIWNIETEYYLLTNFDSKYDGNHIYALFSVSNKENMYIFEYIKKFIISFGILTIAVSIILASLIASGITKGLKKLEKNALALSSGNLDITIDTKEKDEVGKLARSFDKMRNSIATLIADLKETNESYQRFVPSQFLEILNKHGILNVNLGDCRQMKMTILFSDIRDFTTLSDSMTPKESFEFINQYLKLIAPIIKEKGGFIDKYIGDAVMALFPSKASQALDTAIEMCNCLERINEERVRHNKNPLQIGIGLNTGMVMIGIVGEEQRLDATVIGDSVNVASRIESMTKHVKNKILISHETFLELNEEQKKYIKCIGKHHIKGKEEEISLYEVQLDKIKNS
ncbi:adenylate/guanylate cyclase domain-containing protein [Fluviispira multicolorata]|uniref:HAMP domain-containing protein n=1 Tax=Fluviispira multicolorata TaxID=2654512 RepID=A0A833JI23_9BACT|nr:adenylate/guanylate cyclase domain-containing protein [Fluviispira multicolorata]KAB8033747.1 HAMP domain-containing protein [Fluviispira multicolorata]